MRILKGATQMLHDLGDALCPKFLKNLIKSVKPARGDSMSGTSKPPRFNATLVDVKPISPDDVYSPTTEPISSVAAHNSKANQTSRPQSQKRRSSADKILENALEKELKAHEKKKRHVGFATEVTEIPQPEPPVVPYELEERVDELRDDCQRCRKNLAKSMQSLKKNKQAKRTREDRGETLDVLKDRLAQVTRDINKERDRWRPNSVTLEALDTSQAVRQGEVFKAQAQEENISILEKDVKKLKKQRDQLEEDLRQAELEVKLYKKQHKIDVKV